MTILLTGFEPFGGAATNSSWQAVRRLSGIPGLVTAELPVEFGRSTDVLGALIAEHQPAVVIAVGVAAGRSSVTPERVAINLEDARIPDNAGGQPRERAIVAGGPAGLFSALPVARIAGAILAAGIPSEVSLSAGTYVCNSVMYSLLSDLDDGVIGGFIHVPAESELPLEQIVRALEIAVRVTLEEQAAASVE